MPSPATKIPSRHEVTVKVNQHVPTICGKRIGSLERERQLPHVPARCPKGCPRPKTLRMAKDCHKTWH
eukprot:5109346-Amphidinium_carterae.1